ncbi:uncharacterized protein RB166_010105 [Leptodactylus fuscus]
MDSSTSGKSKGGTPNRPLTSRPSLSRNTKTGSSSPSPKVATESPRPATSKAVGPISKPTATKVGTAVKEANTPKGSTVRAVAASPIKSKTVTQRDPASPLKPPAKQTTRPQNEEKGTQQTASLLVTKNEAAKKTAGGTQLNKPKPRQEGGNAAPSKQNGTVKREVGKLPEHGLVPKDKTLCLQSESSSSVPSKRLATASSPTKTLKANSLSHKPKQIVPPPEKPINATSLSTKATKSPLASTRPGATTSTTPRPTKTASPLVKTPRPTLVLTKVTKTPTSPVKPVSTSSAPTKPRNATPAKPPGNTMSTTNQAKVGKRSSTTTKATSVPAKQVNNAPTPIRPQKPSTVAPQTVKEECAESTPKVNEITPEANASSQILTEMNKTEKTAELEMSLEAEEVVAVPVKNVIENNTADNANIAGEVLRESELPLDTNESTSPTKETNSQDEETISSLSQEEKSCTKDSTPPEIEEVGPSIKEEPKSEYLIVSDISIHEELKPFEEQPNATSEHLQETLRSPLEIMSNNESTKRFEEQPNVPWEDLRSPVELAIHLAGQEKPLEEKMESARELTERTSSEYPVNNESEGVHIPIKTLDDEVIASSEPSKETAELLMDENRSFDEEQVAYLDRDTYLNQSERIQNKPLDEETFTAESAEPLEDVVTSSLEQVTPLEEEVELSEDEIEPVKQKGIPLGEEHRNLDQHIPLELLTSSTEELTPSEEEAELLKDEKETLQERISYSEYLDMEEVECKPTEIATFSMEPVIFSKEEVRTQEEPFGHTVINDEISKTSLDYGMPLNEGKIPTLGLLHSSVEEVRLSEEDPMTSVETLQSSFEEVKSSQKEATLSVEPLQTSVEEVKLSEEEPLLSVESLDSTTEPVKSPHENQMLSVEALQVLPEDIQTSQEEPMLSVEPLQTSVEEVKLSDDKPLLPGEPQQSSDPEDHFPQEQPMSEESHQTTFEEVKSSQEEAMMLKEPLKSSIDGEHTSSLTLLNSSLEPLMPLEGHLISSFDPIIEANDDITSLEETIQLEVSQSPVQLPGLGQHLVPKELIEEEEPEREELLLPGQQGHLMEQDNPMIKSVQYDAEIHVDPSVDLPEHVEQANVAAHMDPEEIYEKLSAVSQLCEEPLNMMYRPDYALPNPVMEAEKQQHSAEAEVEDISNPIKLGQFVQESLLFPEEPLNSIDESKTTSVEADDYPEKPIQSSLEQVKCADYEEAEKTSIHELMGYPEDLTTSPEKTFNTAMYTTAEDKDVFSSKSMDINISVPTLPDYQEHLESDIPMTLENDGFVKTYIEPQVSVVLPPLASIESIKHELLMQSEEPEDETNILAPTSEETNNLLHYQINHPESPESLSEHEHRTDTVLEKSTEALDDFYMTMDPIDIVRNRSTNQETVEKDKEEDKKPAMEVKNSEEPISFTVEESLEPLDTINVLEQINLEQNNSTEILEQTIPVEGAKHATESTEVDYSDESTSISHTETSSLEHTFSPATNTISVIPTEQKAEASKTTDLHLQNTDPCEYRQETEGESWELVKMEELTDYKEEPEERPLRPASLNQDAEVQDEQRAEEELVERASVCSTLSDPQLAAKSSSETSTPEELRTYEDSSSGVESHSDDAATSPQTTLTPDPDLGIHMGQEEGTETPAGTPASNNKGVPPPLQIVDIEGQSQSTSPSGVFEPSENNQIVRKKEIMASNESREHDYEARAKERGAQRGNDD